MDKTDCIHPHVSDLDTVWPKSHRSISPNHWTRYIHIKTGFTECNTGTHDQPKWTTMSSTMLVIWETFGFYIRRKEMSYPLAANDTSFSLSEQLELSHALGKKTISGKLEQRLATEIQDTFWHCFTFSNSDITSLTQATKTSQHFLQILAWKAQQPLSRLNQS